MLCSQYRYERNFNIDATLPRCWVETDGLVLGRQWSEQWTVPSVLSPYRHYCEHNIGTMLHRCWITMLKFYLMSILWIQHWDVVNVIINRHRYSCEVPTIENQHWNITLHECRFDIDSFDSNFITILNGYSKRSTIENKHWNITLNQCLDVDLQYMVAIAVTITYRGTSWTNSFQRWPRRHQGPVTRTKYQRNAYAIHISRMHIPTGQ